MNAENFVGLEMSVQPQDKGSFPGIAALNNWRRIRSFSDRLRCLHAVGSQTRVNDCGLLLGKAGISTAVDTICLLYGPSGENNSKILLIYRNNMVAQPFCVLLDQLAFNKRFFSQEILFYALL